ncbi:MAG: PhzF family phenazine biosynthesis protein [Spirochaetales bacterium]|nr:PhzF family phenazine biosynthesis protein [Leptospiraceae bacterium]MCP5480276.1 PhzF family phenazine biosynthesis protein [Spirochaetales bacterium]MCP5486825.1 PhzF family phenazine biosynthesis protein [Spirochaetales bacterium]
MRIPLFQVDAFTRRVFGGNPAAVCPLEVWLPTETMQKIAAENNLSETVFFVRSGDSYEIRWFSPLAELDLAGHPTLAAAYVIAHMLEPGTQSIRFESHLSGSLYAAIKDDVICLDFPARPPQKGTVPAALFECMSARPTEVLLGRDAFAVFERASDVRKLTVDERLLTTVDLQGLIATAPGEEPFDFVSRYFAPRIGIAEDPVTGSAHATLTPYWAERLNRKVLRAYQASRRGGELLCELQGERVLISGSCALFLQGEIVADL